MTLPPGVYFHDGVPTYARDDRGPLRVQYLESGTRVLFHLWSENDQRDRDDREFFVRNRVYEARGK